MTQDLRPMTRDAVLALAALSIGAGVLGGGWLGLGTLVSGIVGIGNFLLLAYLVRLSARATAAGKGAGAAVALLLGKTVLVLAVFAGLVTLFGPLGPALGAGSVVLALSVRGLLDALHVSDDELPEGVV